MKRKYITPSMTEYELRTNPQLLTGSPTNPNNMPVGGPEIIDPLDII